MGRIETVRTFGFACGKLEGVMDYASARFACTAVGNIVVGFHTRDNPNDDDWTAYLECGRVLLEEHERIGILAYSLGGGPNAVQRGEVNEMFKDTPQRVAVMLDSRMARGAVTALSWFNNKIHAFKLDQQDEALAHLGATPEQVTRVKEELAQLGERVRELGGRGLEAAGLSA